MSYVEEMVQCPYHPYHVILKSRFITHLCKCRKQYGGTNFSTCPFNTSHSILTPELQYHISVCPDRTKLDSHIYVVADEVKKENVIQTEIEVPTSENWDDEPQTNMSYLDVKDKLTSQRPLLRLPAGKSKAQRREFFANEVQRIESLKKGETSENFDIQTFNTESIQKSLPTSTHLGRGSKQTIRNETDPCVGKTGKKVDDDDDDFDNSFAIVLKNRGRGRATAHGSGQSS